MPNTEPRTMMFETPPCAVLSFGENAQQTRNIGTRLTARDGSKSPETRKKSTLRTARYHPIRFRNLVLYPTELPGLRYLSSSYDFSFGIFSKHATNTRHWKKHPTRPLLKSAILQHRASLPNWLRKPSVFYRDCCLQDARKCQP